MKSWWLWDLEVASHLFGYGYAGSWVWTFKDFPSTHSGEEGHEEGSERRKKILLLRLRSLRVCLAPGQSLTPSPALRTLASAVGGVLVLVAGRESLGGWPSGMEGGQVPVLCSHVAFSRATQRP